MAEEEDRDDLETEEFEDENEEEEELDDEEESSDETGEGDELTPEEVKKLKEENDRMRKSFHKKNKEMQKRRLELNKLKEAGLDVDSALELQKKAKEQETQRALKRGDVEKIKKQLEDQYTGELETLKSESERLRNSLYETTVNEKINQALTELQARKGANKAISPYLRDKVQIVEEEGRFVPRVIDEEGDVRFNSNGDFMSVTDFVEELSKDDAFGQFFIQTDKSGGGSAAGGGQRQRQQGPKNAKKGQMSRQEKADYIHKYGYDKPKMDGVKPFARLPD